MVRHTLEALEAGLERSADALNDQIQELQNIDWDDPKQAEKTINTVLYDLTKLRDDIY